MPAGLSISSHGETRYSRRTAPCTCSAVGVRLSRLSRIKEGYVITVLIVIFLLMALGSLPSWPYSSGWGYYPSGGFGLILLILIVLALSGRL